jgi:SAM-dependent methyltransferase
MTWNSGYIVDVEYTHGYYVHLSPARLRFACLAAGILPPETDSPTYLELGFGQGLSINIHAAACSGEFWGNDFNPSQASYAQAFAKASGSGARLLDDSFAELAARPDLPQFDIIALHGIWTWISDENRRIVVDLIRRKLRVGGILYISYNCLPGLAPILPLRHLMHLHASIEGSGERGVLGKIEGALNFAQQVASAGAMYFRNYPAVADGLKSLIEEGNRQYLAHEYFNDAWGVMFFSELVRWLEPAKVSYATSANFLDHVEGINFSEEGAELLSSIHDPVLQETVRDYLVDQKFRKDIFIKGRRNVTALEQFERLANDFVVLTVPAAVVPSEVPVNGRKVVLQEAVFRPLIDVLAEDDHAPKQMRHILAKLAPSSTSWPQLLKSILVLMGIGCVQPACLPTETARQRCAKLNRYICELARKGQIEHLASPVTGTGIRVPRFFQLFLLAAQQGRKSPGDQAAFVWEVLAQQGEKLVKDGKALETAEENIAELTELAVGFAKESVPLLNRLGIA